MGISGITSTSSMSTMQMASANSKDHKSKNIQSEIANVQQQMQKLSSKEDLSANEKTNERKKLQKEISSLNTELKRHEEELQRSQKRKIMLTELREDGKPEKEESVEDGTRAKETSSPTADQKSAPSDAQQPSQQSSVITKNSDGTVILKEASNQEGSSVTDTDNKRTDETKKEANAEKEAKAIDNATITDTEQSDKKMHAMISADSFMQQASRQGMVVAKSKDGIAILKGEIKQDEIRDENTEKKQAELEKMERREEQAMEYQFSILGDANNAIKKATETNTSTKDNAQANVVNNLHVSGLNVPPEEQASQPNFYVSIG